VHGRVACHDAAMSELDDAARDKLLDLWRELGSPESSELPADRLEERGTVGAAAEPSKSPSGGSHANR
jgi:hypothetical protein